MLTDAPLHRQRRQRIAALVAHAGRVDRAIFADGQRGNLASRRFKKHVALAFRADAINQAAAV
jgi:hypothetical protein